MPSEASLGTKVAVRPRRAARLIDGWTLAAAGLSLVLAGLVLNPLLRLLVTSVSGAEGGWTLLNYVSAFSRERYVQAFVNSMELGVAVVAICLLLAVPLAWGVSRTDMPGRKTVRLAVLCTFVMPPYLGAIGWILLAGPNAGWLNQVSRLVVGAGLFNIYTFSGLAFVIAIYTFQFLFIFVQNALDVVSSEMEDAANILGAGTLRTALRVTLPMVLPAILAGCIITFLEAISLVGTPALIALPARVNVITTQLMQFFSPPIRVEVAAAYTMPLLLVTVGSMRCSSGCCGGRATWRWAARGASGGPSRWGRGAGCWRAMRGW